MTIEFFDGFEYGINAGTKPEWVTGTIPNVSTSNPRSGAFSMTASAGAKLLLPASTLKTIGFAYFPVSATISVIVQVLGDAGATTHLTVGGDGTGAIILRRGSSSGTIIATSAPVLTVSAYQYIEVQATIADSGGTCIIRHNGVEVISFTGDTKNGGTNTTIDAFNFDTASTAYRFDDLYVVNGTDDTANTGRPDNTFLGDMKVEPLLPSGNGDSSQFTNSGGTSVNNYTYVDEVTPSTADYVGALAASGLRDFYAMANVPSTTVAVYSVRVGTYAAKTDAGAGSLKVGMKESGGTITFAAAAALSTTYLGYWDSTRNTKPSGGAWSTTDVNGLQAGIEAA